MEERIFYVTKEKLKQLKKEHAELVEFEHNKVMGQEAPRMLESEDMNPEFISYHEDIDSLRFRIEELHNVIEHHELIKIPAKEEQHVVGVGATIKIDINGKKNEFMITGTLEANPEAGKISNESPVGKALLGHRVGDEIVVVHPDKTVYKIRDIKYEVG